MGDRDGAPGLTGRDRKETDGAAGFEGPISTGRARMRTFGFKSRIQPEEAPEEMIFHSRWMGFSREVRSA